MQPRQMTARGRRPDPIPEDVLRQADVRRDNHANRDHRTTRRASSSSGAIIRHFLGLWQPEEPERTVPR